MAPSTAWKEVIAPGEAELLEKLAAQVGEVQRHNARGGTPVRALHAKGQVGATAEFSVLPDLPEHARVGLFAAPASYRAYVRFSNASGRRRPDLTPDVRGVAIKILGVGGKKLIPGMENETTQDFLLLHDVTTALRDAAQFVYLVHTAVLTPALLLPKLLFHFGPLEGLSILRRLVGSQRKVVSLATSRYFSVVPSRFGPYAVKFSLDPQARNEPGAKLGSSPDYLGEDLAARLRGGPVAYDFRVQFFVDETRTPIEDASVEWKEADAPFLTVARLTLPQQDPASPQGRETAERIEKLSFDPWHALEELRPLGNMMRARGPAYRVSTQARGAAPEPK